MSDNTISRAAEQEDVDCEMLVGDEHVAWFMHVYHEKDQLAWAASNLRRHYPRSRIVVVSDGDGVDYSHVAASYSLTQVSGSHLFAPEQCHLFIARMLDELLGGSEKVFIKIDPDSLVARRLEWFPREPAMWGTLERVSEALRLAIDPPNVQGGCIGMAREVAHAIRQSGLLSPEVLFRDACRTWARCEDAQKALSSGRFLDDFVLSWLADRVGFPLVSHPEVASYWRRPPVGEASLGYAVTHPHKLRPTAADVGRLVGERFGFR